LFIVPKFVGDELQILFVFCTVVFVSTLIVSLTAVKETPLNLNRDEKMPLLSNHGNQILDLPEELTSADDTLISDLLDDNKEIVVQNKTTNEDDDDEDDEEQDEDQPVTLRMLYSSVVKVENQSLN
jgi:hypothetical protein